LRIQLDAHSLKAPGFSTLESITRKNCASTPLLSTSTCAAPFRYGLALFCCVPTTLTSGVTLVTGALGNSALALMLTVVTNVLGVFTVPFILNAVLESAPGGGGGGGGESEMTKTAAQLLVKLVISIIIPMAVGKAVRETFAAGQRATARFKVELGLANNSCLIAIVWMSISKVGLYKFNAADP
jgi:sodium/bile acid cotransporter 7